MTFLNPLNALIRKIPFSFFADFWVWVTSKARGSVSVGFWGSCQLSSFGGGGLARGLDRPSPPQLQAQLPLAIHLFLESIELEGSSVLHEIPVRNRSWGSGSCMDPLWKTHNKFSGT